MALAVVVVVVATMMMMMAMMMIESASQSINLADSAQCQALGPKVIDDCLREY